jgi:plastocyanin
VTLPSDATLFEFTPGYNGGTKFYLADTTTPNDSGLLVPGTYSVAETANSGYVTTATCTSNKGDAADDPSAIHLAAGEIVTCTFTNKKKGTIIVEKQTNPDGAAGSFSFTGDASGSIGDGGQITVNNLAPGTYTSTETNPAPGFDLTSISCDDGASATASTFDVGTRTATFKVDPGETVKCTFTNRKRGTIIVEKQTNPDGAAGSFSFTGDASGSIGDGGQITVNNLAPGTYTSTETNPAPGFDLTSISCDDGASATASTFDVGTRTATFKVDPGETVKCTFTNTKRGTIIVEKQTNPDGAAGSFSFTGDAAGSIGDGGQITVSNLAPGTYTSTEGDPTPGFDLTSISCDDGASATPSTVNVGTRKAYFKLDPGETVKCTFTNRQRGKIVVIKDATPNDPQDFSFSAGGGLSPSSFSLDDDSDPTLSNTQMFNNVTPGGGYSVSETVPQGWDQTSATCDDGSPISNINVSAGETVTCTFNNRKRARLIVEKQTDPDGAAGSFTFTGTAAGTIGDGGNIPVGNLIPGTYTSTENDPTLISI